MDFHDKLLQLEDSLGFYSLESLLHDSAILMMKEGTFTPENDPENHFILNKAIRVVLNRDLIVCIDHIYYKYLDNNIVISDSKLNNLRTITLDNYLERLNVSNIHFLNETYKIEELNSDYEIKVISNRDLCSHKKFNYKAISFNENGIIIPYYVTYYWNFGDGTPIETSTQYVSNGQYVVSTVDHLFQGTSTNYIVTVNTVAYISQTGQAYTYSTQFTQSTILVNCPASNTSKVIWIYPLNGHAMKCEHWTQNVSGGFLITDHKLGSATTHYKMGNNGWKKDKCERVVVQVYGPIINKSDCSSITNISLADWPYNSKDACVSDNPGFYFYNLNQSLFSEHKIKVNGTYYSFKMDFDAPCN
jgi:hypothetical protein